MGTIEELLKRKRVNRGEGNEKRGKKKMKKKRNGHSKVLKNYYVRRREDVMRTGEDGVGNYKEK